MVTDQLAQIRMQESLTLITFRVFSDYQPWRKVQLSITYQLPREEG